jgi:adenylate cyclase
MGDAIMAFWNAPLEDPDHAADACRAALDMGRALEKIRTGSGAKGTDQMEIGIGLNTGIGSVGNMGSEQIYDYTVIGDAVNLASRLEGANKSYGTRIILSESTWEKVKKDGFVARELDRVRVKGKAQPVTVFELVGHRDEDLPLTPKFLKLFAEGLEGYYSQRFDDALKAFHAALEEGPGDQPTIIYTNRCETFRAEPPLPDWDGVFTMTAK